MTENKDEEEQVVMTPKTKTSNSTTLIIERKKIAKTDNEKMHVAGGQHTGIIINKQLENGIIETVPADLCLEFRVYLVSAHTGKHTHESRILRFWFRTSGDDESHRLSEDKQASIAQDFFRELVSPREFPRDYVGFIKKIMKQLQHNYQTIKKVEVELKQLEGEAVLVRPPSAEEPAENIVKLSVEKILELIESAYPNPITIQTISKNNGWDEEEVSHHLAELQSRNLVKNLENGTFTRQQSQHDGQTVQIVKQMPTMVSSKQPTIAIITAQYCEKLAVDVMIENKETYVRYTTVGESNVYTLGNIGAHRIVCTKLPSVGHTREAMTAAGNTTTRLLGTFQKVDYVFLVGVGGGVPHYTDYNKHVRLGDVVVSYPTKDKNVYLYCENANVTENGSEFELKPYRPANLNLQEIAANLKSSNNDSTPPWVNYIKDGLNVLTSSNEHDFRPPSSETDKLYMNIGDKDIIEVAHPSPLDKSIKRQEGCPRIHLGCIASGRQIVKDDSLRQKFAGEMGVLAFDCEFDAVIESILGNCKDSFVCIRGISDYKDGTKRKEWQPYSSLVAASVMKAIICGMEPPNNV